MGQPPSGSLSNVDDPALRRDGLGDLVVLARLAAGADVEELADARGGEVGHGPIRKRPVGSRRAAYRGIASIAASPAMAVGLEVCLAA